MYPECPLRPPREEMEAPLGHGRQQRVARRRGSPTPLPEKALKPTAMVGTCKQILRAHESSPSQVKRNFGAQTPLLHCHQTSKMDVPTKARRWELWRQPILAVPGTQALPRKALQEPPGASGRPLSPSRLPARPRLPLSRDRRYSPAAQPWGVPKAPWCLSGLSPANEAATQPASLASAGPEH